MSGSPFPAFPVGCPTHRPLPPGAPAPFAARLAYVPRSEQPEAEALSAREAYKSLVSAACYLATRRGSDAETLTEAIGMLHQLAKQMLASDLDLGGEPGSAEKEIWVASYHRWERQASVESAIRFVKVSSEARQLQAARKQRSRWARWRDAWLGAPSMQSF